MIVAKRDWDKILIDLQMRSVSDEEMPRLLFECIVDLNLSRRASEDFASDIKSATTRFEEQVRELEGKEIECKSDD